MVSSFFKITRFAKMKDIKLKKTYIVLVFMTTALLISSSLSSQSRKEMKEIFAQAESFYLYEEYDLANQLYLLLDDPANMNIAYKIGTSYLNIADEKEKSIPYLEAAVTDATYDAKISSFKEKRAPLDAYFYLAKAYMINNELEKAISTLETFKRLAGEVKSKKGIQNLDFADQQIEACRNAILFKGNPAVISTRLLSEKFTEGAVNENPAVSFDGNTIVYTEKRGLINTILFSKKIRGIWQPPVDITDQLNAGEDCSSCSLNSDGTQLFLYKTDNYDGNIYTSHYIDDSWTPIVKLNKNINTKYYESHASVSANGSKLYFTSNREGGYGGLDIYVSEIDTEGEWGIPVNLGVTVNTPYNEDNPFITKDGETLFFSSEGHKSMGGYDLFKSTYTQAGWSSPENLGFPVNSTDDDKFLQPHNNGMNAFHSRKTDYKKRDIFFIGLEGPDVNLIHEIAGTFRLNDTILTADKNCRIEVLDKMAGDTLYNSTPNPGSGLYNVSVPPGQYRLIYSGKGYFPHIIDTTIVRKEDGLIVAIDITLERDSSLIPRVYARINPEEFPVVAAIDSNILVRNMRVDDVTDQDKDDSGILYYTVQVMALYNPVDVSHFKYIDDILVMFNENDKFYRYTSGRFATRDEASSWRLNLIQKGYPEEIFVKKVSRQ